MFQNSATVNEKILFSRKENDTWVPLRYLYIKISAFVPCKVALCCHTVNKEEYRTESFDIHESPAVYMFDFYRILAASQRGTISSFLFQAINSFSIISDKQLSVEWSRFSNNRLALREESSSLIDIIDYPETVHLEVTRSCNLTCYMCRENRAKEVAEIGVDHLELPILYKMIPFLQNVVNVALFGWGEPLCHPNFDKFIDAVGTIKDRNHSGLLRRCIPYVSFTTNATLLTKDLIYRIIESELDEIYVSIDSLNPQNYNFIRKGADFEKVMNNLRVLRELKKQKAVSHPKLKLQFVAMRRNVEELPGMIKFAADLGIETITVNSIVIVTKGLEQESLYYHQELANRVFTEAKEVAKLEGIYLSLPPLFGTRVDPQGCCTEVQEMFYVKAEGTVIPCCVATDAIIGDLSQESPEEIWHGERRKKILNNLRKGILEGKCKGCYKFTGNDINSRETHIKV
jgi:radical SAM protein with 4Fe4S-binding SPASM domain